MNVNNDVKLDSISQISNSEPVQKEEPAKQDAAVNPEVLEKTDEDILAGFEIADDSGDLTAFNMDDAKELGKKVVDGAKDYYKQGGIVGIGVKAGAKLAEFVKDKFTS